MLVSLDSCVLIKDIVDFLLTQLLCVYSSDLGGSRSIPFIWPGVNVAGGAL
jgi:hypothetical protein